MNKQGVRILSLEAKTIYKSILKNGENVGYILPDKKQPVFFLLFKNVLDYSLDAIELEKAYEKEFRRKDFSFLDSKGKEYSLAVINVKFNYKCYKSY